MKPLYFDLTVLDVDAARRRASGGDSSSSGRSLATTGSGGRVVEAKRVIPGIGWFATCADPGGVLFGVLQPDPSAS